MFKKTTRRIISAPSPKFRRAVVPVGEVPFRESKPLFLLPELRSLSTWNGYLEHCVQLFALCALPLILSYRNEKEERPRSPLLFYILYPLQFLVLYALYVILR